MFLIFVELMLITALALFFSTFSTPLLSAALTFGLYIVGHFNADLRNFEQVVDSRAVAWLARGLYHVLPDLSAFDVKTEVVHGLAVPLGYVAMHDRLRPDLHCCVAHRGDGHLLAAGFQVTSLATERRRRPGSPRRGAGVCLASAMSLQFARDRAMTCASSATERILYVRSGEAAKRLALDFDALAADVYWIRAIQHYGGDRRTRSAPRSYELLYPLLDLTTTLDPYFTLAYRFGAIFLSEAPPKDPGGRIRRSGCCGRASPSSRPSGSTTTTSASSTTGRFATTRPPQWFQRAAEQPNSPNWLRPLVAAHADERPTIAPSARFFWQQMLQSDQEWMRRNAERRLLQLDALDLSTNSKRSSSGIRRSRRRATHVAGADAAEPAEGNSDRRHRHAVRARSDYRESDGARNRRCSRCPIWRRPPS